MLHRPQPISVLRPGAKAGGYSVKMEVLCTIPLASIASVRVLADDFRMTCTEVVNILRQLREFGVVVTQVGGIAVVMIPRRFHDDVLTITGDYWAEVYEKTRMIKRAAAMN